VVGGWWWVWKGEEGRGFFVRKRGRRYRIPLGELYRIRIKDVVCTI